VVISPVLVHGCANGSACGVVSAKTVRTVIRFKKLLEGKTKESAIMKAQLIASAARLENSRLFANMKIPFKIEIAINFAESPLAGGELKNKTRSRNF
jgi:hypothetical protein